MPRTSNKDTKSAKRLTSMNARAVEAAAGPANDQPLSDDHHDLLDQQAGPSSKARVNHTVS